MKHIDIANLKICFSKIQNCTFVLFHHLCWSYWPGRDIFPQQLTLLTLENNQKHKFQNTPQKYFTPNIAQKILYMLYIYYINFFSKPNLFANCCSNLAIWASRSNTKQYGTIMKYIELAYRAFVLFTIVRPRPTVGDMIQGCKFLRHHRLCFSASSAKRMGRIYTKCDICSLKQLIGFIMYTG